jgi:hypothetical protein
VGSRSKIIIVPVLCASTKELFPSEALEASDVVFVANLVHFCMDQELGRVAAWRWECEWSSVGTAYFTDEVDTIAITIIATYVMRTNFPLVAVIRTAGVWEFVVVTRVLSTHDFNAAVLVHAFTIRQLWVVFAFIEVLNEELDNGRLVFWKFNFAFVGVLVTTY